MRNNSSIINMILENEEIPDESGQYWVSFCDLFSAPLLSMAMFEATQNFSTFAVRKAVTDRRQANIQVLKYLLHEAWVFKAATQVNEMQRPDHGAPRTYYKAGSSSLLIIIDSSLWVMLTCLHIAKALSYLVWGYRKMSALTPRITGQRIKCIMMDCAVTFARKYDAKRHKKEVHGRRLRCLELGCSYYIDDWKKQPCLYLTLAIFTWACPGLGENTQQGPVEWISL